jgi:hypothetical protein
MVNYEESFKKPFTDLTKLVIGIVLSFIPIIHWIARGFTIETSGLGKSKPSAKMPEWKNFGHLFVRGLLADIIFFIYTLPAIIIFAVGIGITIASVFSSVAGSFLPTDFFQAIRMGQFQDGTMRQMMMQNWPMMLPGILTAVPLFLLALLLLLIASYVSPIAILNYVKTNKFSEAFNFSFVCKKVCNGKYFMVWLIVVILTAIISAILSYIPVVGKAAAFFIIGVIAFTLYGQIFRELSKEVTKRKRK